MNQAIDIKLKDDTLDALTSVMELASAHGLQYEVVLSMIHYLMTRSKVHPKQIVQAMEHGLTDWDI